MEQLSLLTAERNELKY